MMAKEAVNRAYEGTLADGIHFERRLFHSLFATEDQKIGDAGVHGQAEAGIQAQVTGVSTGAQPCAEP